MEESISTVEFLYLVAEITAATVAVCPSSGEDHGSAAMEPTSWSSSSGMLASDGLICWSIHHFMNRWIDGKRYR